MRTDSVVRRAVALGVVTLAFGSPSAAAERTVSERIAAIVSDEKVLNSQVEDIRRNFTARSGLIGVTDARDRYEEGVYQFLVGDLTNAASTFYILVESRALGTPELARDAEWYLAESLFELGNFRTALQAYTVIVNAGPSHPYFPDAARRSLETYAIISDVAGFDSFYNAYIVSGRVKTTEVISYTLAKSFFRRGESGRAKSMFEAIGQASPYYSRARYFLGVLMIQEKNYTQALEEFTRSEADSVIDDDHKKVKDLSQIALARVHYELGDMPSAVVWYGKITRNSPNYANQLYESAWADIKRAGRFEAETAADFLANGGAESEKPPIDPRAIVNYRAAIGQVNLFLSQFPEHRDTASMKILQGHLHMKLEDFVGAEANYQKVVAEYDPIVAQLHAIKTDRVVTGKFLDELTDDKKGASEDLLPGYAEEILLARPEVNRAANAWASLNAQRQDLVDSDELLNELTIALADRSKRLGTFVTATAELDTIDGNALLLQGRLIDAEVQALRALLPARRTELGLLQRKRDQAYAYASDSKDVDATVAATFSTVRAALQLFRADVSDLAQLQQFDKLWTGVLGVNGKVAQVGVLLKQAEVREMDSVRKSLSDTEDRVDALHKNVNAQAVSVETLAATAVQTGVKAVETSFRIDVLTADKGYVDVAWLRETATAQQETSLTQERERLRQRIEEQYATLRTNQGLEETR